MKLLSLIQRSLTKTKLIRKDKTIKTFNNIATDLNFKDYNELSISTNI